MKKIIGIILFCIGTLTYTEDTVDTSDIVFDMSINENVATNNANATNATESTSATTNTSNTTIGTYSSYLDAGDIAYINKDYSGSLDYYMGAYSLKENDIDALLGIAKSYEGLENTEKALQSYKKVLEVDSDNDFARGKEMILEGESVSKLSYRNKERYFKRFEDLLKKQNYNSSEEIYALGRLYMNDKSFERAYNIFKRDTGRDYRNSYGAGVASNFLGDYNTAIKYYKKTLDENPDFYRVYLGLGDAYKLQKNYDRSIENLKKYLVYKQDENIYLGIADIYSAQEKYSSAKDILEEGQEEFPSSKKIREKLGEIYTKLGRN